MPCTSANALPACVTHLPPCPLPSLQELEEKLTGTPAEQAATLNSRLQGHMSKRKDKQPTPGPGERAMTFEEKRRLSVALGQLSGGEPAAQGKGHAPALLHWALPAVGPLTGCCRCLHADQGRAIQPEAESVLQVHL